MGRLALYGAGGMARELTELVSEMETDGRELIFISDTPSGPVQGIPVLAPDALRADDEVLLLAGEPSARRAMAARCGGARFRTLVSPRALVNATAELGPGAIVYSFTAIAAGVRIGRHFLCSLHSYVGHDCVIGDFVTFAPRVSCNGNVHIGDEAYLGTGAILRQGAPDRPLRIGAGAVIGMGAVVTKDVPDGVTVVGNPAAPIAAKAR